MRLKNRQISIDTVKNRQICIDTVRGPLLGIVYSVSLVI